jgi:hypothetical protein
MVCTVAAGKTIYVDDDDRADFNSIQAAIDDANDVDEVIVSPGVYNENINFGGKNIVLRSTNPDSPKVVANTVIDGGFKGHTVTFAGTETPDCILSGFTITRGRNTYWCDGLGGGIFGNGTFSTIEHNLIYNNKALPVCGPADGLGGGIYNCDGLIQDNMIFGNVARGDEFLSAGGGLYGCDGTIRNNVIAGNSAWLRGGGLFKCNGEIINCTVCYNRNGGIDMCSGPIRNCILWANVDDLRDANAVFSCIEDNDVGQGNIHHDPCFVDTGYWDPHETPGDPYDDFWIDGDYHLKSQAGRWDAKSQNWVKDDVTSPCIDAGDPASPIGHEPFPNGGRINMGAYGGTAQASKSYFGKPICETIIAGDINGDCKVDFADLALMAAHWLESNALEVQVQVTDVKIIKGELVEGWFKEIEEAEKLRIGDVFHIIIKVSNLGCQQVNVVNLCSWDLSPQNHVEVIGDSVPCAAAYRLKPGESGYVGPFCPSQAFRAEQGGWVTMSIHVWGQVNSIVCDYTFQFEVLPGE